MKLGSMTVLRLLLSLCLGLLVSNCHDVVCSDIPQNEPANHEAYAPPGVTASAPHSTTLQLPQEIKLFLQVLHDNPAFVQKFVPLLDALKPYFSSGGASNNPTIPKLRDQFFYMVFVDLPKVLNSKLAHQIVDDITGRLGTVCSDIPQSESANHEAYAPPCVTASAPLSTTLNLPQIIKLFLQVLHDNPAFVNKFVPLLDALKPYFASGGTSNNPTIPKLRYNFFYTVFVDLPKVLNSKLAHQIVDDITGRLETVCSDIPQSDPANHEAYAPPGVTASDPLSTTLNLLQEIKFFIQVLQDNPAFVQKFVPLLDALKPYFASGGTSNNPTIPKLRYNFFYTVFVDLPKVLNSKLAHQIVDDITGRLETVCSDIPQTEPANHEAYAPPGVTASVPLSTTLQLPKDIELFLQVLHYNPAFAQKFVPLLDALKPYFASGGTSNNPTIPKLRDQFFYVVFVDLPKVLNSKLAHQIVDDITGRLGTVCSGIPQSESANHEAYAPPGVTASAPQNTTLELPQEIKLFLQVLHDNPAFANKFVPLFEALKPYFASGGTSNNPTIPKLRDQFFKMVFVDLPKVLNSTLTHQIVDAVTGRLGTVNLTGVDQSNPSKIVMAVIQRFPWNTLLTDLYTIAEQDRLLPKDPSLTTNLEMYLLNFTLGTLPQILKNPLLWVTKDLLMKQIQAINFTDVDTSRIGTFLETIYLRANWPEFLDDFYNTLERFHLIPDNPSVQYTIKSTLLNFTLDTIPRILKNPMFQALDWIIMGQIKKINLKGVDYRNLGQLVSTILIQLHPEEIIAKINALPGIQNPQKEPIQINKECVADIAMMYEGVIMGKSWALKMMDALGKPGSGILKGNLYMTGNYDECLAASATDFNSTNIRGNAFKKEGFSGSYCRITVDLPDAFVNSLGVDTHGIPIRLSWGLCVPSTCSDKDVRGLFTAGFMSHVDLTIRDVFCGNTPVLSEDGSAITAIVILSVLLGLTALGTCIEIVTRKRKEARTASASKQQQNGVNGHTGHTNGGFVPDDKNPSGILKNGGSNGIQISAGEKIDMTSLTEKNGSVPGSDIEAKERVAAVKSEISAPRESVCTKMLTSFSLATNVPKILAARHPKGSITCINGIRYLSMAWVILCHTFYYGVFSISDNQTTENMIDASKYIQRFTFMVIVSGTLSVDTFFLLSGLLVAYLFFKDIDKKKGNVTCMKMVVFYIHRFWRLTPIYMIVIMMFTGLHKYVIFGPLLPRDMSNAENCKINWWTNLLYVNNLVNPEEMCMGWTWYLANDMQFYIISPIFILSLYFFPVIGVILTSLLVGGSIAATAVIENKGAGNMLSIKEAHADHPDYYNDLYIKPWCRVGAYGIGLLLAQIMYKKEKIRMSMPVATIGWIISLAVGLFIAYCEYSELQEGGTPWSQAVRSAYEALSRPAFAACVGWVIYACHTGRGGYINSILSWKGLIPMARLTYAAYLIHPIIMFMYMYRRQSLIYLSNYAMIYFYLGHLCLAYGAAFILSVLFESPFLGLEKIVLKMIGS